MAVKDSALAVGAGGSWDGYAQSVLQAASLAVKVHALLYLQRCLALKNGRPVFSLAEIRQLLFLWRACAPSEARQLAAPFGRLGLCRRLTSFFARLVGRQAEPSYALPCSAGTLKLARVLHQGDANILRLGPKPMKWSSDPEDVRARLPRPSEQLADDLGAVYIYEPYERPRSAAIQITRADFKRPNSHYFSDSQADLSPNAQIQHVALHDDGGQQLEAESHELSHLKHAQDDQASRMQRCIPK